MIREHFDGAIAWLDSRETNGFLDAVNSRFQAASAKPGATSADYSHSELPYRRQARLLDGQLLPGGVAPRQVTHSIINRARYGKSARVADAYIPLVAILRSIKGA
jgi:hypothetical protein